MKTTLTDVYLQVRDTDHKKGKEEADADDNPIANTHW